MPNRISGSAARRWRGPLSSAVFALVERLELDEHDAGVRAVDEAVDRQAGERDRALRRPASRARSRTSGGSRPRCGRATPRPAAARSATRYCLSWLGTKPVGTVLKKPKVAAEQHQHRPAATPPCGESRARRRRRSARTPRREDAVEAAEEPAERAIHAAGSAQSFGASCAFSSSAASAGDSGQRVERRDHRRDGDGQRELAIELAGQAADEGDRNEHRAQHQRDAR